MAQELWGGETRKAIDNFPVSGERVPVPVVRWLGRVKAAAARTNAELGLLDAELAERIASAADEVAHGRHDDQFPIDVFQTGSGTSTNMNANEVIAALAGEGAHPNDHVNMGQSSNDVFPSAVHLAALAESSDQLLPALERLAGALEAKASEFDGVVKAGRTHLMDAVPVTLGQEFSGYAAQMRLAGERVAGTLPRVAQIPLGGTATGTGLNTHDDFAARVRAKLREATGVAAEAPADPFEAQGNRDALVELSGQLKVVAVSLTKIANDIAWMGSGPRAGLAELRLPELQKGSSIMPGKVNPVLPEVVLQVAAQVIGNDAAVTVGGHAGQLRAQRPGPPHRPQPARVDRDPGQRVAAVRRALRGRPGGQRSRHHGARRGHAGHRDGAQSPHRVRPRLGDRQGGGGVGPGAAGGGARDGRCGGDARGGARPRGDGPRRGLRRTLRVDRSAEFRVRSRLDSPAAEVWERVTTFEGVNEELMPIARMTAPSGTRSLGSVDVVPGRRLFRSWILLFGLIPMDYDDVTLVRIEPGRSFLERSPMLSQRMWEHERTLEPDGPGRCSLSDRVRFELRLPLPGALMRPLLAAVFRHRHRRLRRRFGGAALPVRP